MNEQKHIIGREVLEITVPTRSTGMSVQNRLFEITRQKLNPALNKAFTRLSSNDQTIKIDNLTIDLGLISPVDLDDSFVQLAIQQAELKIKELIVASKQQTGSSPESKKGLTSKEQIKIESASQDALNQFIFFLRKGYFPWQYSASGNNALNNIFDQVLDYKKKELIGQLRPVLSKHNVIKRMVLQLSHRQLERLFIKLDESDFLNVFRFFKLFISPLSIERQKHLITSFYDVSLQFFLKERYIRRQEQYIKFFKNVLLHSLSLIKQDEQEKLIADLAKAIALEEAVLSAKEDTILKTAIIEVALTFPQPGNKLIDSVVSIPVKDDPTLRDLISDFAKKRKQKSIRKQTVKKPSSKLDQGKELTEPISIPQKEDKPAKITEEETYHADDTGRVFVNNAGLVLVHPFLRFFFEGINLLDKDLRFKNRNDQYKAVHLLQFIATGQESIAEYELTLNKIICGLDISEPIPKELILTTEDKTECDHLVSTVLKRWDALKTSKPENLRQTFIQREGVLKQTGRGWNLNIERNTFDVMLEKLPWTISIIKLPWTDQMLYVEW